jgi:micrococcal nuclease
MHYLLRILLLPFIIVTTSSAQSTFGVGTIIQAKVIKVVDGDTFDAMVNDSSFRVRMSGIDAPEYGQEFYDEAKNMLSSLMLNHVVLIENKGHDFYHRMLGNIARKKDSLDINKEMVRTGYAWHFVKYSRDVELAKLERLAREKQIGLWSIYHYLEPWEFRKQK